MSGMGEGKGRRKEEGPKEQAQNEERGRWHSIGAEG